MMPCWVIFLLLWSVFIHEQPTLALKALNGLGQPVDWFYVLKLPQHVYLNASHSRSLPPTRIHCNCSMPPASSTCPYDASNSSRASGLCYLYADSTSPQLRYFTELGYDCLGQGGNDPVTQTLLQIPRHVNSSYWAFFNDQFYGMAYLNMSNGMNTSHSCTSANHFNAHSKGAVAYNRTHGGFYMQTSTPNFPDPSRGGDVFVPLGCQREDNTQYAQHFFVVSLNTSTMEDTLGPALQTAGLCSANVYQDMAEQLTSQLLRQDTSSTLHEALVQTKKRPMALKGVMVQVQTAIHRIPLKLLVKTKNAEVPPWALVAQWFREDITVASWWDQAYGIPTICAGDAFGKTQHQFCLNDSTQGMLLDEHGQAMYNVENILRAKWYIPKLGLVTWEVTGGRGATGNHGKWAVDTPRGGKTTTTFATKPWLPQHATIYFGDMNMEGFPCSSSCGGSQGGRGGVFWALEDRRLWSSITEELIEGVCACTFAKPFRSRTSSALAANAMDHFIETRMCFQGCTNHLRHVSLPWMEIIPDLTPNPTSFWQRAETGLAVEQE